MKPVMLKTTVVSPSNNKSIRKLTSDKLIREYTYKHIYFTLNHVDTFTSKYINFDADDYSKLEKTYIKNISVDINFTLSEGGLTLDENIGRISLTYFDFKEAIIDNVNIEELLNAESNDTSNIYDVIIKGFNEQYYEFFEEKERGNIINITDFCIAEEFRFTELISYALRNIDKIIYHLLGLQISTIMSLINFPQIDNKKVMMDIYWKLGFLEVDEHNSFVVKNICKRDITYKQESSNDEVVTFDEKFASKLMNLAIDAEILNRLKKHT